MALARWGRPVLSPGGPTVHRDRGILRRLLVCLLSSMLLMLPCTTAALADATPLPQPAEEGHNPIGACLSNAQVWLIVVDDSGTVLANQCVGNPGNGEQALADAGMRIEYGRSRLICTIDSHPADCPRQFNGQFWHYWHSLPGQGWAFSTVGAGSHHPPPGSVEGWCYNAPGQERCMLPTLLVDQSGNRSHVGDPAAHPPQDPAVVLHAPVPLPSSAPWELIAVGAGAAVLVTLVVVHRRRSSNETTELGGR